MTVGLIFVMALISWADTKPIPRLIEMVSTDAIPEFRLAAARTLVAAYLFIGRPLSELDPLIQKIEKERGFKELRQAVDEAKQEKVISACWNLPTVENPVVAGIDLRTKTVAELEQLAIYGSSPQLREAATKMMINKYLTPKAKLYPEWYTYRIKAEEDFDAVKVQFYLWTVGVAPQAVEIKTIALIPLSQIFFAEFLITLPASQVTAKLKCS
uniref:Uncharacterized protein n=2 Tax=Candidatus Bipolaricaulota TaxID=67810 RepID=H5SFB5_9BACT|nr:hypothetical protein HGMM_F21A08C34 [uncultured Acetothermia bacterium]BAL58569.1 hypothetical protein HGMM_OP2C119 [Candidatus Acetothermum autotrophicum]